MPSDRLSWLVGAGRITLADGITAETAEAAVAIARKIEHGARTCEIWQANRLVAKLDAHDLAD